MSAPVVSAVVAMRGDPYTVTFSFADGSQETVAVGSQRFDELWTDKAPVYALVGDERAS